MSGRFRLGVRVAYADVLVRQRVYRSRGSWDKVWKRAGDIGPFYEAEPGTGILVGIRTLTDGTAEYLGDDGVSYKARVGRTAALIAFDLRRKPVLAFLQDVSVLDEGRIEE